MRHDLITPLCEREMSTRAKKMFHLKELKEIFVELTMWMFAKALQFTGIMLIVEVIKMTLL